MKSSPGVFLSYAREDREQVGDLYRLLADQGFDPWMDVERIEAGQPWELEIRRGLRHCTYFLICLSPNSVNKQGVIQDEIQTALKVREEGLENENSVIPVLLAPCDVPGPLRKYQWVELYKADGRKRLLRGLRAQRTPRAARLWMAAMGVLLLAAIGAVLYFSFSGSTQSNAVFTQYRVQPPRTLGSAATAEMGITLWELRRPESSDPAGSRILVEPGAGKPDKYSGEWTPVRSGAEAEFPEGARIRITFESSVEGYLYVIDREQRSDGSLSDARVIFPTARTAGPGNHVAPGKLVWIPPSEAAVPFWLAQRKDSRYAGELLTFIVAPATILESDLLAGLPQWERTGAGSQKRDVKSVHKDPASPAELASGRALTEEDPAPDTVYAAETRRGRPAIVNVPVRIR